MIIAPREYQIEALEAVASARERGITRQLITLPTGTGKTVVFSLLAREINTRTLIIAHSEELISQAVAKFKVVWPEVKVGVVKAESNEVTAQVVVASIQTAIIPKRLQELREQGFGLMVIDEAHHAAAPSYTTVIKELGFFDNDPSKLLVGVTATPKRGDGVGLKAVFQEIVFERTLQTMIRADYLSPLVGKQVFTKIELAHVNIRSGDFVPSELARIVNTPERNLLIVENYKKHAAGRSKTLAFCADVQHARDLAKAFVESGIPAQAVFGAMTEDERKSAISGFSSGKCSVLTNCQLLTEGFDEPSIDCLIMGRPTQSSALFTQMIGRGTRTYPTKRDCLVLDFTDNTSKHELCNVRNTLDGAVTSLSSSEDDKKAFEYGASADRADSFAVSNAIKVLQDRVEDVEFFDKAHFSWTPVGESWHLRLTANRDIWVRKADGGFLVVAQDDNEVLPLSNRPLPLDYALGIAEEWARRQSTRSEWALKDARWRSEPATQRQLETLSKLGVHFDIGISKGQASQLLDSRLNEPATERQLYWLRARGIPANGITKIEARKMIAGMQPQRAYART